MAFARDSGPILAFLWLFYGLVHFAVSTRRGTCSTTPSTSSLTSPLPSSWSSASTPTRRERENYATWACAERIVPKTGGAGFFTQLLSDGTLRELPFPSWDLVAFHGTRDLVTRFNESQKFPPTSARVRATTSTSTSSPGSNEYLNVQLVRSHAHRLSAG